jgi:vacuolar-type H+-ATPase subunit E/Vma4
MPAPTGPLLDELQRDAQAGIAARTDAARAEAARIRDIAAAHRERRRAQAVAERERALATRRESARAEAGEATLGRVLTARDAFLGRVFAETEQRLNALAAAEDLPRRLAPLLADALPFVEGDEPRARCAGSARAAVAAALVLLGRADLPIATDDAVPLGAVLERGDRSMRVVATLVARMERMRPTLAIEAVREIDAGSAAP